MSRTRRYLHGMGVGYAFQALTMGVGLFLTRFLLARLGAEQYGLWLVGMQLLGWLLLLDVGVVALVPRELAVATGRVEDPEAPARMVGATARLVLLQTALIALVSCGLWLLLPQEWAALRPALGPTLLAFVLLYPLRVLPALLEGVQDLGFSTLAQMGAWGLGTLLTVGLVLEGTGMEALAWGWIAQQVVLALLSSWRLWRRHRYLLPRRWPTLAWAEGLEWLRRGAWVSVDKLASLLVGKLLGPEATVAYACTGKAVSILIHQPRMLVQAALPGLSQMRTGEPRERLLRVCTSLTQATLLASGFIATGVVAANSAFVSWWVGPDKYLGPGVAGLLVFNMVLRHWSNATALATFCFGDERRIALTTLADGAVALVLGAAGLKLLGPMGAPLGATVGLLGVSVPGHLRALARHAGTSPGAILRPLWPWAWRTAGVVAVCAGLSASWPGAPLSGLLALSAAAVVLYAAGVGPSALQPPLESYVRPRWRAVLALLPAWLSARFGFKPEGTP